MKYTLTYDLMESARNTHQWLGATARAFGSYPAMAMTANPAVQILAAWGEVTERTYARMVVKPDWGIPSVTGSDGKDHPIKIETLVKRPFGDLIRFTTPGRKPPKRRVLLVAPMSGHYATLLRKTVISLLPDCDVHVTDWHNARDIPASEGKFDVEDYTSYLVDFMRHLGPDLHVIAVCQPAPLTLAATALLAEDSPAAQPRSLTLIGGPIDPDAAATDVTDFGRRITMGQLEHSMIQRVGFKYKGVGRQVYPGLLQLASFIAMNGSSHAQAFTDQIFRVAQGDAADQDKHNQFYDEYLAVMDMTAEFYLSTVDRVFKNREIARNAFTVDGRRIDIGKITSVAVKVVEGENDDISAPGQCLAALDLLTGLPESKKAAHLEPGAGHYGIFAGGSWRNNIRPLVLAFIDANSDAPTTPSKPATKAEAQPVAKVAAKPAAKAAPKPAKVKAAKTTTAPAAKSAAEPAAKQDPKPAADAAEADAKPNAASTETKPEAPKAAAPAAKVDAKPETAKADAKPAAAPQPAAKTETADAAPTPAAKTADAKPADAKAVPATAPQAATATDKTADKAPAKTASTPFAVLANKAPAAQFNGKPSDAAAAKPATTPTSGKS